MFLVLVTGSNKCSNKNDKKAITFPYFLVTGSRSEDGVPDMTIISNIDEKGINRNLRVRYERDIIYVSQSHILLGEVAQMRKQMLVPDLYVFTLKFGFHSRKKTKS